MELRRVAPVLGLCALLAADAVLIAWAFRGTPVAEPTRAASVRSTTAVASPSPSPTKSAAVVPVERVVAGAAAGVAWVAQAGSCDEPGTMWVTGDGGATWESRPAPGRVLRARPSSATAGFVTGGDARCRLRLWSTADAGRSWGSAKAAADAWSRMPEDARSAHTPDDSLVQPCGTTQVLDLVGITAQRATVLCGTGEVRTTADRGVTWDKAFSLAGSRALSVLADGSGVIVRTGPSCAGVVAVPLRAGKPNGNGVCVRGTARPGEVSVSGGPGGWWLVVGDRVHTAPAAVGPWRRTKAALGS